MQAQPQADGGCYCGEMEYWCGIPWQCGHGYLFSALRRARKQTNKLAVHMRTIHGPRRVMKRRLDLLCPKLGPRHVSHHWGIARKHTLCCLTNPAASCLRFFLRTGSTTEEDLSASSTTLLAQKAVVGTSSDNEACCCLCSEIHA